MHVMNIPKSGKAVYSVMPGPTGTHLAPVRSR